MKYTWTGEWPSCASPCGCGRRETWGHSRPRRAVWGWSTWPDWAGSDILSTNNRPVSFSVWVSEPNLAVHDLEVVEVGEVLLSAGEEVEPGEVGAEEGLVGGGVAAPSALALPCQAGGEDQDQQPAQPVQPPHLNSETKILPHSAPYHCASNCISYYDNLTHFIITKWSDSDQYYWYFNTK